jgi:uncharacterized protein
MIHKISVENFFSIAEKQEVDLRVPANAPDRSCFRLSRSNDQIRLPLVVGIYGPNASGKSTLLRAVTTIAWFVRGSFSLQPNAPVPLFHPYMNKEWWNRPTKIAVEFDGRISMVPEAVPQRFRYELHLNHEATTAGKEVAYEALFQAPKKKFRRIFERRGQKFDFGRDFEISASDDRVKSIRSNASVISTLAQLNHKPSSEVVLSLQALQTNISGLDKSPPLINQALNFYHQNPPYLARLNRELSRLDLGLEEMKITAGENGPIALFKHIGLDAELIYALESTGTKKFIEIFPLLQYVMDVGGVAIIDELDNDIHPLLAPQLFRWFYDKERNKEGGQLLFTAHNAAFLNEMEKDQVFFTEKPGGKSTHIYGAGEIKGLRREPSLMKKYLSGELGAVPHIG